MVTKIGAKFGHEVSKETREKIKMTMLKIISEGKKARTNKGSFIKGQTPWNKGKNCPQLQGENHPDWKGGNHKTARVIALRYGKDLSKCQICGDSKRKIHIHHINGNYFDNREQNMGIVCSYCHNAIHDSPNRKLNRFQVGHALNSHY